MNGITKPSKQGAVRLFFAIQPPGEIQTALNKIAKNAASAQSGWSLKSENIHLTLIFLGDVEADKIDRLRGIAANITGQSFSLTIQGTTYWKKNHIVMAKVEHYPAELFELVNHLKTALVAAGFVCENRKYKPHITLIRKAVAHQSIQLEKPIQWDVNDWLLMQSCLSEQGARYSELGRWPLNLN
ncbi:MAG: RNA 2',3'-cyclic phosphodiesterase [Nitrosomonas sp.]|nr:RNA 2',3'-cyclic phosphodiesterase [Nitrosomonas sp.]